RLLADRESISIFVIDGIALGGDTPERFAPELMATFMPASSLHADHVPMARCALRWPSSRSFSSTLSRSRTSCPRHGRKLLTECLFPLTALGRVSSIAARLDS